MKKIIIMPTINVPTVLTQWAWSMTPGLDEIIVAGGGAPGDDKPHGQITSLLNGIEDEFNVATTYLRPEEQRDWQCSESMGWFTTCRRNIALLEALRRSPDLIVTLDDDNAPALPNQLGVIESLFTQSDTVDGVRSPTGWYDPGELCVARDGWGAELIPVSHRGFPISRRFEHYEIQITDASAHPIGVFASLWTGAPDIDAYERLTLDPVVERVETGAVKLMPETWAPFDSQATYYLAELAPLMMCWPGVGRYDDIWASYLARRVMDHMGYVAAYGHPTVHQDRNPHNYLDDLEVEMFGMRHNDTVIDILRNVELDSSGTVIEWMTRCYEALEDWVLLPYVTRVAFKKWVTDLDTVRAELVK